MTAITMLPLQEKKTTEGILLIEDARTSIKIAKVDKTSGEKVEGAKIQILDKEGIVFEEWRSGKEAGLRSDRS